MQTYPKTNITRVAKEHGLEHIAEALTLKDYDGDTFIGFDPRDNEIIGSKDADQLPDDEIACRLLFIDITREHREDYRALVKEHPSSVVNLALNTMVTQAIADSGLSIPDNTFTINQEPLADTLQESVELLLSDECPDRYKDIVDYYVTGNVY